MPEPEVHIPGCAFLDGTGPCRCWDWKDQMPGRNVPTTGPGIWSDSEQYDGLAQPRTTWNARQQELLDTWNGEHSDGSGAANAGTVEPDRVRTRLGQAPELSDGSPGGSDD